MEKPLEIILQDTYDLKNEIGKAREKPEQISVAFVKHDAVCYDHEADKYAFVNTRLTEKDFEDNSLIENMSIEIVSDGEEYVIKASIDSKLIDSKLIVRALQGAGKTYESKLQPEEGVSLSLAYVPQPFSKRVANSLLGKKNKGQLKWSVEICRNNTKNIYTDLQKVVQYLEKGITGMYEDNPKTAPLGEIHLAYHPEGEEQNLLFGSRRKERYENRCERKKQMQHSKDTFKNLQNKYEACKEWLQKPYPQLADSIIINDTYLTAMEGVLASPINMEDFLSRSYDIVLDHSTDTKVLRHYEKLADGIWKAQGAFVGYTLNSYECFKRRADQRRAGGSPKRYCPVIEE